MAQGAAAAQASSGLMQLSLPRHAMSTLDDGDGRESLDFLAPSLTSSMLPLPKLLDLRAISGPSRIALPFAPGQGDAEGHRSKHASARVTNAGVLGDGDGRLDSAPLGRWVKNKKSGSTAKLIDSLQASGSGADKGGEGERLADDIGDAHAARWRRTDYGGATVAEGQTEASSRPAFVSWDLMRKDVQYAPFWTDVQRGGDERAQQLDEAVLSLLRRPPVGQQEEDQMIAAPDHTKEDVLVSLIQTACGQASTHFAWDELNACFTWSETLHRNLRAHERRGLRRAIKKTKSTASLATKKREEMTEALNKLRMAHPLDEIVWRGKERIRGLSEEASEALVARFLDVGSLQRRLQGRIEDLGRKTSFARSRRKDKHDNNSDDDTDDEQKQSRHLLSPPPEAYALASSLSTILDWVSAELQRWNSRVSHSNEGLSRAHQELEVLFTLLTSLSEMCGCSMKRLPPFRAMTRPPSRDSVTGRVDSYATTVQANQLLTLLYAHMHAVFASSAPPLVQGVWSYLLSTTTRTWREQLATWVGWPSPDEVKQDDILERQMTIERERKNGKEDLWRMSGGDGLARCEPWPGAEVEWDWDERGEEDVGYILRPSRLPSILPLHSARSVLEAGRALRLLRRAAPTGHPLLSVLGRSHSSATSALTGNYQLEPISVPCWTWSDGDLRSKNAVVETQVHNLQREIARWRKGRGVQDRHGHRSSEPSSSGMEGAAISFPALGVDGLPSASNRTAAGEATHEANLLLTSAFSKDLTSAMLVFDAIPGEAPGHAGKEERNSREKAPSQSVLLKSAIANAIQATSTANGQRRQNASLIPPSSLNLTSHTEASVIAPLLRWSRLIHSSLISVFFRDLGLATYLETCRRFLLLGNRRFADRIEELLFDADQYDGNSDNTRNSREGEGVGLSKTLRSEVSWPPSGDSQLSSALNFVVLETIADLKSEESAGELDGDDTLNAEKLAIRDLDDRLSFAVVHDLAAASGDERRGKRAATADVAWRDRRNVEALDWLTLSFHPPPLIAPLLTPQTQKSYKSLFNHLLRLMRVRNVLSLVFRKSTSVARQRKQQHRERGSRGTRKIPPQGDSREGIRDKEIEKLILAFRVEAQLAMDHLQAHATEVAIGQRWDAFMARLGQLRREAEERDMEVGEGFEDDMAEEIGDEADDEDGPIVDEEERDDNDNDEEEGTTPADALGTSESVNGTSKGSPTRRIEVRDVFSLARYHEWTLERMVTGCFLSTSSSSSKGRNGKIYEIIEEIMNLVLRFGDIVLHRTDQEEMNASMSEGKDQDDAWERDYKRLTKLHRRFRSRVSLLARALEVVLEHSSSSNSSSSSSSAPFHALEEPMAKGAVRESAAALELQKQEEEAERDLRELQRDGVGASLAGANETTAIRCLILALSSVPKNAEAQKG